MRYATFLDVIAPKYDNKYSSYYYEDEYDIRCETAPYVSKLHGAISIVCARLVVVVKVYILDAKNMQSYYILLLVLKM